MPTSMKFICIMRILLWIYEVFFINVARALNRVENRSILKICKNHENFPQTSRSSIWFCLKCVILSTIDLGIFSYILIMVENIIIILSHFGSHFIKNCLIK